eukprot:NODE_569_length_6602_cov_0.189143.p2 type:complete len:384 gc:universal NODE_569_length_6602_cov_0.189143:3251-2100(-)
MDSSISLELKISCTKLKNKDTFSKSDPYVVVYENKNVIGKTETVKDDLNPSFFKLVQMQYFFEKVQTLVFEVRDDDGKGKYEALGSVSIVLCDIVTAGLDGYSAPIVLDKKQQGSIKVIAREIEKELLGAYVRFSLSCSNLDKKDLFGKSDPYLLIYKANKDGNVKVHKSEIIKNTLDPIFKSFDLPLSEIGENKVRIECWDWDRNSKDDLIGVCEFDMQDHKGLAVTSEIDLVNPSKKSGKRSGVLLIRKIYVHKNWTFLDFIQSGTQLCFSVAIDYTASNGEADKPGSLHYIGTPQQPSLVPTLYEQAISSIGGVLEYYDNDKTFPTYGFGAKFANGKVYHNFHVNFNEADPNIQGIDGVLRAYRNCLYNVRLFGPTVVKF